MRAAKPVSPATARRSSPRLSSCACDHSAHASSQNRHCARSALISSSSASMASASVSARLPAAASLRDAVNALRAPRLGAARRLQRGRRSGAAHQRLQELRQHLAGRP
ncbi:MAG: hypothetical protein IPI49_25540 [Myxococcales bacterium]|nr:hypothetical protein [Myxococcales bacterium]